MDWLADFEYRRSFEFKIKDDPLVCVVKGCPEGCKEGRHIEAVDALYLHGRGKSFPKDIVFTRADGVTPLRQYLEVEVFYSKDDRNPPWELVWAKFAIDRYNTEGIFRGYVYYGNEK